MKVTKTRVGRGNSVVDAQTVYLDHRSMKPAWVDGRRKPCSGDFQQQPTVSTLPYLPRQFHPISVPELPGLSNSFRLHQLPQLLSSFERKDSSRHVLDVLTVFSLARRVECILTSSGSRFDMVKPGCSMLTTMS